MSAYRFHASAPPGEWINDPNALLFAGGTYQLFVQHAADAPGFKRIGWGRLSSPDLMSWRWEGVALPPEEGAWRYSGSTAGGRLFFTEHDPNGPCQRQRRAVLTPDVGKADILPGTFGPEGRNARDPFVWRAGDGWRMLVARPCDWTDWRGDPPSTLELWRSPDLDQWMPVTTLGGWSPPGVMWEVPALIDFGEVHALILSLVDRRADTAECEVRYWLGRMSDQGFARAPDCPSDGMLLDLGPDFYAAIPNTVEGWPTPGRVMVGWASNWRTARTVAWPESRGGGPISMPRHVKLAGDRLTFEPAIGREPDRVVTLSPVSPLRVQRDQAILEVAVTSERVRVRRNAPGLPPFERDTSTPGEEGSLAALFIDGPLVEIVWRGVTITAALPGDSEARISSAGL